MICWSSWGVKRRHMAWEPRLQRVKGRNRCTGDLVWRLEKDGWPRRDVRIQSKLKSMFICDSLTLQLHLFSVLLLHGIGFCYMWKHFNFVIKSLMALIRMKNLMEKISTRGSNIITKPKIPTSRIRKISHGELIWQWRHQVKHTSLSPIRSPLSSSTGSAVTSLLNQFTMTDFSYSAGENCRLSADVRAPLVKKRWTRGYLGIFSTKVFIFISAIKDFITKVKLKCFLKAKTANSKGKKQLSALDSSNNKKIRAKPPQAWT